MNDLLADFEKRAEAVLFATFGGQHHWPKMHKKAAPFPYWHCNYRGDLSTFDGDKLTRLVLAAHDQCVRVSVAPSGPGMVKIEIHNRKGREGRMHERHPTISESIERLSC